MRVLWALLLVLVAVPRWAGEERLPLPQGGGRLVSEPVLLHADDPRVRRTGRLRFEGGIALSARDAGFGGYSALHVAGDRFVLLGDGGNLLAFRMGGDLRPRAARLFALPGGPTTGWRKADRDSEALAFNPASRRWWVAFENHNAIWRYAPGFARAERGRRPTAMRRWPTAGGPEAMVRLADGRFVVLGESARPRRGPDGKRPRGRVGLIFPRDPTDPAVRPAAFLYRPAPGYDPVDLAELPDGRVLVLERGFRLPFRWLTRVVLLPRGAIRPGALVSGREVGRLGAPMIADNFEGIAAVREGGRTVVWLVSDDNDSVLQRTLLLKFALIG